MKKSALFFVLSIIFWTFSLTALANENPSSLAIDPRMKIVEYNPRDVVTIVGNHLITTDIDFANDENIVSVELGDSLAWTVSVPKNTHNILSIKPILPSSDSNLTVITDERIYHFRLLTTPDDSPHSRNVTYSIQFKYVDNNNNGISEGFNSFAKLNNLNGSMQPLTWNENYSFTGSKNIAPIKAADNGTFTVFEFANHVPMPAIFAVDLKRNESLLNTHTQGNYIFVQGVYHQYTFRNGNDVTSIYNDSYSYN